MLGVENFPALVGGGTDGAAVNVAGSGTKSLINRGITLDILVVVFCISPRICMQGCLH